MVPHKVQDVFAFNFFRHCVGYTLCNVMQKQFWRHAFEVDLTEAACQHAFVTLQVVKLYEVVMASPCCQLFVLGMRKRFTH